MALNWCVVFSIIVIYAQPLYVPFTVRNNPLTFDLRKVWSLVNKVRGRNCTGYWCGEGVREWGSGHHSCPDELIVFWTPRDCLVLHSSAICSPLVLYKFRHHDMDTSCRDKLGGEWRGIIKIYWRSANNKYLKTDVRNNWIVDTHKWLIAA